MGKFKKGDIVVHRSEPNDKYIILEDNKTGQYYITHIDIKLNPLKIKLVVEEYLMGISEYRKFKIGNLLNE